MREWEGLGVLGSRSMRRKEAWGNIWKRRIKCTEIVTSEMSVCERRETCEEEEDQAAKSGGLLRKERNKTEKIAGKGKSACAFVRLVSLFTQLSACLPLQKQHYDLASSAASVYTPKLFP